MMGQTPSTNNRYFNRVKKDRVGALGQSEKALPRSKCLKRCVGFIQEEINGESIPGRRSSVQNVIVSVTQKACPEDRKRL